MLLCSRRMQHALFFCLALLLSTGIYAADKLKPYILANTTSTGTFQATVEQVKSALQSAQFQIVGEYAPYDDAWLFIVTNNDLKRLAGKEVNAAFLAGQRVSVTKTASGVQIAYTNPDYFAQAYRIEGDLSPVSSKLAVALGNQDSFGSKGLTASKLRKYHYAFGMEYFDDQLKLAEYAEYRQAVKAVSAALDENRGGVMPVYRIDIPESKLTIFGVSMSEGMSADSSIMEVVDYQDLKCTAHLPYEIIVDDNRVKALAPRFRIAIDFPDLKMTGEHGFTRLMSSPDAIAKALTLAAGAEWMDPFFRNRGR